MRKLSTNLLGKRFWIKQNLCARGTWTVIAFIDIENRGHITLWEGNTWFNLSTKLRRKLKTHGDLQGSTSTWRQVCWQKTSPKRASRPQGITDYNEIWLISVIIKENCKETHVELLTTCCQPPLLWRHHVTPKSKTPTVTHHVTPKSKTPAVGIWSRACLSTLWCRKA